MGSTNRRTLNNIFGLINQASWVVLAGCFSSVHITIRPAASISSHIINTHSWPTGSRRCTCHNIASIISRQPEEDGWRRWIDECVASFRCFLAKSNLPSFRLMSNYDPLPLPTQVFQLFSISEIPVNSCQIQVQLFPYYCNEISRE